MAESNSSAIPTDEVASRRVGTVVKGKWTIDALLGTGGMASVYAATHRNGQRAALKIMHTIFARDKDVVDRFLREGYVANKIGHSACVRAIDDDVTDDGEPFLVMELLEGETLRDLWKRTGKRVPLPLVMHVAERLLDCLAACHAAGVIHRDLKPANIYVTTAGDVKVLDFGVALMKDVTAATAGMALGTPAYMSPEQAKGLADKIDHRVDIFSVGAVIHALASGKRVHRAKHEQDALKMAATTPAPSVATIVSDLPPRVVALIDRALAWEPSDRFADAKEMQAEVVEIEKELKASASRPVPATTLESFHDDDEPMEVLAEDHPRTFRARGATRALGEAIDTTRACGRHDPEARSAMDRAFEVVTDALAQDRAVIIEVRQAAFFAMGHLAWVPSPGGDRVPRELYAAGVRALAFTRGLGIDEVVRVVALLGGSAELPADHDLATALWELGLRHVRARGRVGFLTSDAQGRERRTASLAELEAALGAAQRKYALRLANPNLRAPKVAGPLSLDADTRSRLLGALVLGEDELIDRHTDLMTAAMLDAAKHGEVPAVLGALRRWAIFAMSQGLHGEVMRAARALCGKLAHAVGPKDAPKLEGAVMSAAFGKEALVAALANLDDASRAAIAPVLSKLTAADWPAIVAALHKPMSDQSASILLESVERIARSKTAELAAATQKAPAPARRAVRAWLTKEGHRDAAASVPATKPGEHALASAEPSPEEGLVVALAALAKLASNKQQSTAEYERRVGDAAGALARMPKQSTTIQLEIAQTAVYVDGKLARLSQSAHAAAMELAGMLAKDSSRIVTLPRAATADALRRFGVDVAASTKSAGIERSPMSDVARTYGADLPHLTIEQRLVASDGAFTLALRELATTTKAGPRPETPAFTRAAQAIVDDSVGTTAALMGLATHAPDALTTKVAAAIVALAAAREITDDRRTLAAIVAGAAMSELPRPAMLVGLGNADPTSASAVIAWEAARALSEAEPPDVSFAAELVAAATRWVDLRATQSYDEAIRELANDARLSPFALRAICACTGVIPGGTLVELSDGEIAEVIAANEEDGARPQVRLVSDPSRSIDLEQEDELVIARVLEVDGWKAGPTITAEVEAARPANESKAEGDERSLKAHSIVRESMPNEPAPTAEGKLATTPLLHVMVYVLDRALSGTLEFRESDGTRHRIALTQGAPTRVVTGRLIAPLGAQLVSQGKLTDVQAASAITNAKAEGMPLGKYLTTAGKLSGADLQRALEVQVRRKLAGLVNLPEDATYAFYKDADRLEPPPSLHQLDVDPLDVILEGVRAWTQRERIRETLARYAQLPIGLHPEATPEVMDLTEGELSILARLRKEPAPLAALLKQPPIEVNALMSLVYTLVITRQVVVPGQVKGPLGAKPWKVRHTPPPMSRVSKESASPVPRVAPAVPEAPPSRPAPTRTRDIPSQAPSTRSPSPSPASARPLAPPMNAPPKPSPAPKVPRVKRDDTMKELARIEQHLSRKDIPMAARVASQALTQDATDPDLRALDLWVKALAKTLKPAEVIEQLGVILLDYPDCTRARLFRAKLYKRDNAKLREAVADFEQVLVDDPTNKDAAAEVRLLRLMVKPGRL